MSQLIVPSALILACQSQDMLGDGNLANAAFQSATDPTTLVCVAAKLPAFSAINDSVIELEAILQQTIGTGTAAIAAQVVISDLDGTTNAVTLAIPAGFSTPATTTEKVIRVYMRMAMLRGINGNGDECYPLVTYQLQSFNLNGAQAAVGNGCMQPLVASGFANMQKDQRIRLEVTRSGTTGSTLQVRHGQIRLVNANTTTII